LGFLDKPVKDDDMAAMDAEQRARDPIAGQSGADLHNPSLKARHKGIPTGQRN
jgi:hypothetical protein